MLYLHCNAYGERFTIECKTEQTLICCKNILKKQWVDFKESEFTNGYPTISGERWLKEYIPNMLLGKSHE